jgi:hypothetical protein
MRGLLCAIVLLLAGAARPVLASDELVTSARTAGGESIPYILTAKPGTPAYVVILMPGGPVRGASVRGWWTASRSSRAAATS